MTESNVPEPTKEPEVPSKFLTAEQVAKQLGVKRETIWKWGRLGLLETVLFGLGGGERRYTQEGIDKFIASRTIAAKTVYAEPPEKKDKA